MDTSPLRSHDMQVPQRPSVQVWGASIPVANAACSRVSPAAIGTVWSSPSRVSRKLLTLAIVEEALVDGAASRSLPLL